MSCRIMVTMMSLTLATIGCRTGIPAQEVPAEPPDSVPSNLQELAAPVQLADNHQVSTTLLMTTFHRDATQGQRQAAIEGVGGRVIGGIRIGETGGVYLVLVPGDSTLATIEALADSLQRFPGVREAGQYVLADVTGN